MTMPSYEAYPDDMIDAVESDAGNYYGYAAVWKTRDGQHKFGVENWDEWNGIDISPTFYAAFCAEFAPKD